MRIKALGALALDGHEFRRPKPLLVAIYLCLQGATSKRRLSELFWPNALDARDSLSTTLRRLNGLRADPLVSNGDPVSANFGCDAAEFLAATSDGDHARAVQLYEGPFLGDVDLAVGEEVEEWMFATRERISNLARGAHIALSRAALERSDSRAARLHAEAALDLDYAVMWEDEHLSSVVECLHAAGSQRSREAMALAQDLGVVYTLRTGAAGGPAVSDNIPRPGTVFVGRAAELKEVQELLFEGPARLVTLHGPGGTGKSRLAIEACLSALEQDAYPGEICFVPLETVSDETKIASALAVAMRLVLPPTGSPEEHLIRVIGSRRMLIVFDNFEHLAAGAPFVANLLRNCPYLDVIVTSRVSLGLSEEHVVPVSGLAVDGPTGDSEALRLLFARMRQNGTLEHVTADDELAAPDLCLAVDGSPLAIELAAAQTRLLPLTDLLAELGSGMAVLVNRDPTAPERQRSMQAALDISWRLLGESDRAALAKLSVFRGGFTRRDCLAVAGVDSTTLQRLLDASFLRQRPTGRYERHPIVRQFSSDRLAEDPALEMELKRRHAEHYLGSLASRDYEILSGATALRLSAWIEQEFPNLEAALNWCVSAGELSGFEGVALPLAHFAELRGRFQDVARLLESGIAAADDTVPDGATRTLPNTLGALPFTYFRLGRYRDSMEAGRRALEGAEAMDPVAADWPVWAARQGMALSNAVLGDLGEARRLASANVDERPVPTQDTSASQRRRCITDVTVGTSLQTVAYLDIVVGAFDSALQRLHRALELFEPFRAPNLGYVHWTLAEAYLGLGDVARARETLDRGLEIAHETGFRNQVGHLLCDLSLVHLETGDTHRAEALAKQALEAAVMSGDKWLESTVRSRWGLAALRSGDLPMASERLQAALEVAGAANAFGFALEAVLGMAELLRLQDHRADGALLVAFVEQCPLAPAALSAEAGRALESSGWSLDQGALADLRRSAAELSPPEAFSLAGAVRVPVQTLK
ncbi:MAG TPA: tetratricopeptide repeat protein [Trueperaceae bacterium]